MAVPARGLAALAACLLGLGAAAPAARAEAEPGDLDRSFGGDGRVVTDFSGGDDGANAIATRANQIVAAGSAAAGNGPDFAVGIYNLDGSLRFDEVTTSFGGSESARAVAIHPELGIVAAGLSNASGGNEFAVARYFSFGALNPTFGEGGRVTTDLRDSASAYGVAIQADGKVVVAGRSFACSPVICGAGDTDFGLARYNPDGSLDTSFDGDGKAVTGFGDSDIATAVAIQSDGKIVAAGETATGNGRFALARYNPNGSLDSGFDGDGKLSTDFSTGFDAANAVAIQADGKIIAAGYSTLPGGDGRFALARYNPDGSLDSSFDSDGKVTTDFSTGSDLANGVAIQGDGKIVAAGRTATGAGNFALARYNTDGTLDRSFGDAGRVRTGLGGDESARGIAIQDDTVAGEGGKIVVAGRTSTGGGRFFLARYHAVAVDDTPPQTFIDSGPPDPTNDPTPTFEFRSSEPGSAFRCAIDDGAFVPCTSPHTVDPLSDGNHVVAVRATDKADNTDPFPARRFFTVDTAVAIGINGKQVKLNGTRRGAIRMRCPDSELSGPCAGELRLKTARQVRFGGKRRKVMLAKREYSVGAGRAKRVRFRLSTSKARLVRRTSRARGVRAIAPVGDGAGNSARVAKRVRLRP